MLISMTTFDGSNTSAVHLIVWSVRNQKPCRPNGDSQCYPTWMSSIMESSKEVMLHGRIFQRTVSDNSDADNICNSKLIVKKKLTLMLIS